MPRNWAEEPPRDWAEREAHRIAVELRRVRGRSAQQVADRTAELGMPVSRTIIADLENGRRRYVSTAELIAIASAIEVRPVDLLYPSADEIEALPGAHMSKSAAVQMFTGIADEATMARQLQKADEMVERLKQAAAISEEITTVARFAGEGKLTATIEVVDPEDD